jgi:hypothetical protein
MRLIEDDDNNVTLSANNGRFQVNHVIVIKHLIGSVLVLLDIPPVQTSSRVRGSGTRGSLRTPNATTTLHLSLPRSLDLHGQRPYPEIPPRANPQNRTASQHGFRNWHAAQRCCCARTERRRTASRQTRRCQPGRGRVFGA